MEETHDLERAPGKIGASMLALVCALLGVVGLVLPIIPGLLFLALAAVIVGRQIPWVHARLSRHPAMRRHLHRVDGFLRLRPLEQMQVAAWLCLKALVDGAVWIFSVAAQAGEAIRRHRQRPVPRR